MVKNGILILALILTQFLSAQNPLYLVKTGIEYENREQLQQLYYQYNQNMLIVEGYVYLIPCDCVSCRNSGGDNEGRNYGGDGNNRNAGGEIDGRNMGGDADGRNQGGDADSRNMGGDADGRNFGGESNERNQGGEGDGRNFGGDNDGRNSGGEGEGRNQGGDMDGRNQGGDNEGRNAGAEADFRMNGGELSAFECERKSRSKFILSGINKNAEVYFFDGTDLIEVDLSKDYVKF